MPHSKWRVQLLLAIGPGSLQSGGKVFKKKMFLGSKMQFLFQNLCHIILYGKINFTVRVFMILHDF